MNRLDSLIGNLFDSYGVFGMTLMGILLLLFLVQLYYWLVAFGRLPKYRNSQRGAASHEVDGISVVFIIGDDYWFLSEVLPKFLEQRYDDFEVVVVEVGTTEDLSFELQTLKHRYKHLTTARINPDPRFPFTDKMAFNVGIKAARYQRVVLSTPDTIPMSNKWLECMAKGFSNGDVIIAYCGLERAEEYRNRLMRCARLMQGVRYLNSAVAGRPYRGILNNIGFNKSLYFENRGFGYLDMNVGIDDLFVQRIATRHNTSIVMNPHATVRQKVWGGFEWWQKQARIRRSTYSHYPMWVKNYIEWELGARLMFYVAVFSVLFILPYPVGLCSLVLFAVRALLVRYRTWLIRKRLGEPTLGNAMMLYDFIEPVSAAYMNVRRVFKTKKDK